ncbi:uncharacterized protein LOC113514955 [Galleria mellonella]|uniref:Uncharacterized protein LOC113514955 n=1 Tax=Galleria mellonella TaxID=7137 RepID=A0A6J1WRH1_GALME|nr:uncharacterized protein LOC113514955 [Galleria mellonella]XP_052752118.1 uncharacterized protein LOC113514955 [Galleria mellonella]
MGQEQSYAGHSIAQVRRYKDKYDPQYRNPVDYRSSDFDDTEYKRHKIRRSADSYKSDNSSIESSGYRSGSSAYECHSERSSKSDYYCMSLYKNDHYKEASKELYKPVKITKEKRYKLQLFDVEKEELKTARLKNYLSEAETHSNTSTQKKGGIRNYTPKILSEEEQRKKVDKWI